jgi:purine-nucleoside phosphorylase
MHGYTGSYHGKRISVQGTGIGIPSTALYVHELIYDYGVKKIIRLGTCGAIRPEIQTGQLILAEGAYTDSYTQLHYFDAIDQPSLADPGLLFQAKMAAERLSIPFLTGTIFSTDMFYSDDPNRWDHWAAQGILGIEMETSILYAMAQAHQVQALTILTVSDNIVTHSTTSSREREQVSDQVIRLAIEIS